LLLLGSLASGIMPSRVSTSDMSASLSSLASLL
jgi:hypothetical protein